MTASIEIYRPACNGLALQGLPYAAVQLNWNVGDVVRKLREQKRWTQSQLARKAKVNKGTVASVEEHVPGTKRETYEKIATAFDLTLGELFSMVPSEETQRAVGSATAGGGFPEGSHANGQQKKR